MKFGEVLKNLRVKKGVSIKELAGEIGLDYTYISKLENFKVNPSAEVIRRFSHYFDYDADELMLSAKKIPDDISEILRTNPKAALNYLRSKFGASR